VQLAAEKEAEISGILRQEENSAVTGDFQVISYWTT
jgi:hypothetical protein